MTLALFIWTIGDAISLGLLGLAGVLLFLCWTVGVVERWWKNPKRWWRRQKVTTICPKCHDECFVVTIHRSGSGPSEFGTNYWFEGHGKCADPACRHEEWISDSAH